MRKKSPEKFEEQFNNIFHGEYRIKDLSLYRGSHYKMPFIHTKCGTEFLNCPNNIVRKNGLCPSCKSPRTPVKTHEDFVRLFKETNKDYEDYEILTEYTKNNAPIKMLHRTCNKTYETTANIIMRGCRCPICYGRRLLSKEEIEEKINIILNTNYKLLQYNGYGKTSVFECGECGCIFSSIPSNLMASSYLDCLHYHNHGKQKRTPCPHCRAVETKSKISKGERAILSILTAKKIPFQWEFYYEAGKSTSRFDFAIFNPMPDTKWGFIEFDGEQHFVHKWKNGYSLQERHDKDLRKNAYCVSNGYPLLRIRYDQIDNLYEMVADLLINPQNYLLNHNTNLNNDEYYEVFAS